MKKVLLILGMITLFSCDPNFSKRGEEKVYQGHRWDVIKINDSIYIALPGLNAEKSLTPIMFNVKEKKNENKNYFR